jgi:hypothetical protein
MLARCSSLRTIPGGGVGTVGKYVGRGPTPTIGGVGSAGCEVMESTPESLPLGERKGD